MKMYRQERNINFAHYVTLYFKMRVTHKLGILGGQEKNVEFIC